MPESIPDTAPLPWLGKPEPTTATQAWSPHPATLAVSYPFQKRDFLWLMARQYQRILPLLFVPTALLLGLPFVVALIMGVTPRMPLSFLPIFLLEIILIPPIVNGIAIGFITLLMAMSLKKRQYIVTLSAVGASQHLDPPKPGDLTVAARWADVRKVEDWQGGIYLNGSLLRRASLFIPASAFADADEARLFADTVRVLHESGGDMSRVFAEARVRFASPTGVLSQSEP